MCLIHGTPPALEMQARANRRRAPLDVAILKGERVVGKFHDKGRDLILPVIEGQSRIPSVRKIAN